MNTPIETALTDAIAALTEARNCLYRASDAYEEAVGKMLNTDSLTATMHARKDGRMEAYVDEVTHILTHLRRLRKYAKAAKTKGARR